MAKMQAWSDILYGKIKFNRVEGGASIIAREALKALKLKADEIKTSRLETFMEEIKCFSDKLLEIKPSMSSVINMISFTLESIPEKKSLMKVKQILNSRIDGLIRSSERAVEKIAEYGEKLIRDGDTILTHSYSSTTIRLLERSFRKGKAFKVIVTESRPQCEGYKTVSKLLSLGIRTTLIIDAVASSFVKKADKVIVGADSILTDGSVINKVGTLPIALAAYINNVPFLVAAETLKIHSASISRRKIKIEQGPSSEIVNIKIFKRRSFLRVKNPVFEVIPARYINYLITERGIIPPSVIKSFNATLLLKIAKSPRVKNQRNYNILI